jgi:hypothetical protein
VDVVLLPGWEIVPEDCEGVLEFGFEAGGERFF